MSKITEARKVIIEFLKQTISCDNVTVIKLERTNDVWHATAEVYEDDSFLKSMNLPPKKTRIFYSVHLDENMEISAYERISGSDV
ncbi:MAG: gas vesicle protein GvpO [Prolixibacteraceae bacterium]